MKVTIVYDNCSAEHRLRTGWGFSCLIETEDLSPILFDTGSDGVTLLQNMRSLGIDPRCIEKVVISHAHSDHTGGLSDILALNKEARIYVPASTKARIPGREVVLVSQPLQVSEHVFSTGELAGIEQSLALRTDGGIVAVTGCSHPGVGAILDAASRYGKIRGILGGFHGFHDFSRLNGLYMICPCHCTQYKEEIAHLFPEQYVGCGAGLVMELEEPD